MIKKNKSCVTYNGARNTAKEMMLPEKTTAKRKTRNIHQHLLINKWSLINHNI